MIKRVLCCSVLQCVAVCCGCCGVLCCVAVYCSVLQCDVVGPSGGGGAYCVAGCCRVLQCVAACCSVS